MTLPVTVQNRSLDVPSAGHRPPRQAACVAGAFGLSPAERLVGLQEAQDRRPQTYVVTARRRMDERGNLLVAAHPQKCGGGAEDVMLGQIQPDDSASARAAR